MSDEKQPSFRSYTAFWPYYLSQHANLRTRYMHIGGTLLGLLALVIAVASFSFVWLLIALFLGYGLAWWSHVHIEKNQPATLEYPLWSLRGDFQMLGLWITGRLHAELVRHKIPT